MSNHIDRTKGIDYSGMNLIMDRWVVVDGKAYCIIAYTVGGYLACDDDPDMDAFWVVPCSDITRKPLFATEEEAISNYRTAKPSDD
mgnify:CR=1 FL=1